MVFMKTIFFINKNHIIHYELWSKKAFTTMATLHIPHWFIKINSELSMIWYETYIAHMIWPFLYCIVYRTDDMVHWQGSKSICRNELISSSDSVFQNSRLVCCRSKIGCLKTILMIFGRNTRRWNFWACHSKKMLPKMFVWN